MEIAFLTAEGFSLTEIYRRLTGVDGDDAVEVSSFRRWVRRFKSREKEAGGRPAAADRPRLRRRRRRQG